MRPVAKSCALWHPVQFALASLCAVCPSGFAAPVYWGQTAYSSGSTYEGSFATIENWFTDPAGTQVAAIAPGTRDDDLVFNTTPANAAGGTVAIGANIAANSLTFNTSGATILAQDANRNLVLGDGGITLSADSGDVSIGINVSTLNVRLAASQTWTNHSARPLSVRNVTTQAGSGPVVLSVNAAGPGNVTLPLSISDTLDDPLSIVIESVGSGVVAMGGSSYSGGTTINRGKLTTSGTTDTGVILLGDTTGGFDATLTVNSALFPNDIAVRSGSSGGKFLVTRNSAGVFDGAIILDDTLFLSAAGNLTTFSGVISGAGALVKEGKGAVALAGNNTFSGGLMVKSGTVTLTGAGSLTFSFGGTGAPCPISGDGAVVIDGTFNFMVSGSLADGSSWPLVTVSHKTFGPTFAIAGFTQADDLWTNGKGLTFSESTGVLSCKLNP